MLHGVSRKGGHQICFASHPSSAGSCGLRQFAKISKSGLEISWLEAVILIVKEYGTNLNSSEDMVPAMRMAMVTFVFLHQKVPELGIGQ